MVEFPSHDFRSRGMFVIGGSVVVVEMVVVEMINSLSLIELLNRSKVFLV